MTKEVWLPHWQQQDVQIKQEDLVYQGFYQVKGLILRHRLFSGEWSAWLKREQVCRQDAAAILLLDSTQEKFVMVEQCRLGLVRKSTKSPWMLEIVAGLIDGNESPEQTAQREALEEAKCPLLAVGKIATFYNTPGAFSEKTHIFWGVVDSTPLGGKGGMEDEHEDIYVHVLPIDQVLAALTQGLIEISASTFIALQWFQLNKQMFFSS